MTSVPEQSQRTAGRRHEPVVILLTIADFEVLKASAREHGHDTYLHAQWLLTQALGLSMPVSPELAAAEGER